MLQLLKKIKTPKNNEIRSEINSLNYIHQIAHTVHYIYVNYAHKHTLASSSSVSVLTPNRGMFEFVRLDECCSFFTPLIWDMGLFFFSFSFCVWGDGISTSCCLSGETQKKEQKSEYKDCHDAGRRASLSTRVITHPGRCWRWTQRLGSQSGSSPRGAWALYSTSSWTESGAHTYMNNGFSVSEKGIITITWFFRSEVFRGT